MEWINIKDELPKKEIGVLVYGKSKIGGFYNSAMWYKGRFVDLDNPKDMRYVTHWMPLPAPPKN